MTDVTRNFTTREEELLAAHKRGFALAIETAAAVCDRGLEGCKDVPIEDSDAETVRTALTMVLSGARDAIKSLTYPKADQEPVKTSDAPT